MTATAKLVALLKPKRSWLQYRLRTMFVLVVIVAIPCGWLKWKLDRKAKERAAVAEIERVGGRVQYDWKRDGKKKPYGAAWLRKFLGDEFFSTVVTVRIKVNDEASDPWLLNLQPLADIESLHLEGKHITDNGLVHLRGLTRLKLLHLHDTGVTGTGLVYLKELTRLRVLSLWGSVVSVASLDHLNSLNRLVEVNLNNTSVTDAGLVHLNALTGLQSLHLADTAVTDAGVIHVKGLNRLKYVGLKNNAVTSAGEAELQKALPNCTINR